MIFLRIIGNVLSFDQQKGKRKVAHEPPLLELLPEAAKWRAFHDGVYETYQREGTEAAMQVKPGDVIEVYLEEQL